MPNAAIVIYSAFVAPTYPLQYSSMAIFEKEICYCGKLEIL